MKQQNKLACQDCNTYLHRTIVTPLPPAELACGTSVPARQSKRKTARLCVCRKKTPVAATSLVTAHCDSGVSQETGHRSHNATRFSFCDFGAARSSTGLCWEITIFHFLHATKRLKYGFFLLFAQVKKNTKVSPLKRPVLARDLYLSVHR